MMRIIAERRLFGVFAGVVLCFAAWLSGLPAYAADPYPVRPVRIITPFPTGSGPDTVMRMVATRLSSRLGQNFVVENRPGGNGFIALSLAKTAAPDGYTLALASSAQLTTHTLVYRKLPYDPVRDFQPVTSLFRNSFFIVVSSQSPYRSVGDIVSAARAKPGAVSYASEFVGSPGHLGALTLASAAKVTMSHVPFKETTQLFNAVANGEVAWAFGSAATAGHLQSAGRVRYLAIGMPSRLPAYPDVPTVPESGGPAGYTLDAWVAMMAPRGTPAAVARRLHGQVASVMQEPDIRQRLVIFGYEAFPVTAEKLSDLMASETVRYDGIIKAANLTFD